MSRPVAHRLFYAILPPAKERQQLGLMRDEQQGAESIVADDRLHLTLAVTPEYPVVPKGLVAEMTAAGDALRADPVEILLDQLSGSNKSVALRPAKSPPALRLLNNRLEAPLRRLGAALDREFSPHLTLLYRKGRPFVRAIQPIAWQATEFVLIHSHIGHSRHETLGRWPLAPMQGRLF